MKKSTKAKDTSTTNGSSSGIEETPASASLETEAPVIELENEAVANSSPVEEIAPEAIAEAPVTDLDGEAMANSNPQEEIISEVQEIPITGSDSLGVSVASVEETQSEFIESESQAEPIIPSEVMAIMAENTSTSYTGSVGSSANTTTTTSTTSAEKSVSSVYGNYDDYQLLPEAPWPPPVFIRKNISPQERYYIEHRWYSQWSFFDKKAGENKSKYFRTQLIVGVGSVTVPVLVGIRANQSTIDSVLYIATVIISLAVAISTAIESLYTYGDNWRSYRKAAEDLKQEKSMYDVKAGRYENNPQPFIRFVERCEEIIAQQNGLWVQSQEKQAQRAADQADDFLDKYVDGDDDDDIKEVRQTSTSYNVTETTVTKGDDEAGNAIITPADTSAYSAG